MTTQKLQKHKSLALTLSAAIFLVSLTQQTFYVNRVEQPDAWANGFANLAFGLLSGNPSWFANPLLFVAWIVTKKKSIYPILFSAAAFAFAISFYFNGRVMGSESGLMEYATNYLIGYWLWLASILLFLIYHLILLFAEKRTVDAPESAVN